MAKQVGIALTFIMFLLLFTAVGIYSATRKQNTTTDYLLASRNVNPWLTALSAMATGQSGLLFIGQVGFAYKIGISSLWLTIGWAIGDYLAWYFIFKRLRQLSEETASDTVSSFLSQNMKGSRLIAIISAIITIIFLGSYAAAQLVAGSKALNAVFGWNYNLGIIIGAVIVVIYCFSGGIRASIWTDALQATIMIGSLLLLLVVAVASCGGTGQLWQSLAGIDPALINWNSSQQPWGFAPFFIGWIVAGFGVVGQPHIMVRAMAIDSADNIAFARNLKAALGLVTSISAMGIGLTGRVLMPDLLASGDPELALPYLSLKLLPVVLVGLMLAGLFSATMSTADSQILSCSAALTQDIFPAAAKSYQFAKVGTLTVTAVVLAIALLGNNNVFALVTFSWSALASGLGPLLILRVWQRPVNLTTAIAMMGIGIATALIWNLGLDLSSAIYEVLPGMAAGMAVYGIAQFLKHPK
ncbi:MULTISPECIES: sodium/proline symporter [unclassified Moorena]|uniref:sodium/proline symporter n=1 Tax=unclassified Moorena TaxID=2683338 RepID=UPI0013C67925|nr:MULTISPECIES: sodium/proline symporter [unclassified Moorena]NEO23681.1 sodium/proline symporter [Moorena sp. SIO4A5]NEQ61970.1 sodium/proline symporter [Moorena sp. SIO4A1]